MKELSRDELLIPATRYYIGRQTAATIAHAIALARNWHTFPKNIQIIIQTDLTREFERDDAARNNPKYNSNVYPLGSDMDRQAWETVRIAWESSR